MIRKQLFQLEDIKGKTVLDVARYVGIDDLTIIAFDDSYIAFEAQEDHGDIELTTYSAIHIGESSIATEEEKSDYERIQAERNKKIDEYYRLQKLAYYEKLKAELGL